MADPRTKRSLSNAFMAWLNAQPATLRTEIVANKRRGRVNLRFPRFPILRGRVWNHCLAIYAGKEHDAYRLFDLDCLPILWPDEGIFVCGFCDEEREQFESREDLFADHLFEPFGRWMTCILMQATGIDHKRLGRWRFARLAMPATWDESKANIFERGGVDHLRFYRRGRSI